MRKTHARLQIEHLEARTLLSTAASNVLGPIIDPLPPIWRSADPHQQEHILGELHGTYSILATPAAGGGPLYRLRGSGWVDGLGQVTITGDLHAAGVIGAAEAGGNLTLANAKGTLTLQLTAPTQAGLSSLPDEFRFSVVEGTGAYKGWKGKTGSIDLRLAPILWAQPFAGNTSPLPPVFDQGSFTIVIEPPEPATHKHEHIVGNLHGTYSASDPIPDVGDSYQLNGTGSVKGLGQVRIAGSLHATGFTVFGRAGGELTLSNARGNITLQLVGPWQNGFAALPEHFHFWVEKATGAYKQSKLTGTVDLTLDPILWIQPLDPQVIAWPLPIQRGSFTLTIETS
jgi:hypothetical protein